MSVQNKPKPKFSEYLFWDIDIESFDIDKYPIQTIERILQYGTWEDWKKILEYYGIEKIKEEVVKIRSLDKKTLNYISIITNLPKTEFKCYKHSQLLPEHWS